ncbi:DUF2798 domain-containing protein [Rhodocytophaga rosea]|uniref:DUF2798 domain-containing protein n=2 Tax=Rhodocytophaga rosea TaxID=2704465 RepID=A0A6C0GUD6_9BACT|nr:DUF2798 domain-containing protein [Rhodocytophaga rosea]
MLMGIITTGIVSFTLIGVNRGYDPGFASIWMKSWVISYLIVIPIILLVSPSIQRVASYLCKERTYATQNE